MSYRIHIRNAPDPVGSHLDEASPAKEQRPGENAPEGVGVTVVTSNGAMGVGLGLPQCPR